jgi:protein-L-isoaspartate(D-aspartate) O-methyltransferase
MSTELVYAALRAEMELQLRGKGIRDERVLAAMGKVPRERFVLERDLRRAYADCALPIGFDQTISQPYMVAATCELLGLSGDENVLEVGTGSGYAAAVLAELAPSVTTIERVSELATRARETLAAAGYVQVEVVVGDGSLGVPERSPFHAIAVAAAAPRLPDSLYEQLVPGGRLVVPIGSRADQRLVLVVRSPEGPAEVRSLPCRYVPLLGAEGFEVLDRA